MKDYQLIVPNLSSSTRVTRLKVAPNMAVLTKSTVAMIQLLGINEFFMFSRRHL